MAKVVPVCSSSKGNCTYIGNSREGVLIDAGCSFKALKTGLDACGVPFDAVKAILVTHEHIDHTKALKQITKHTRLPIFASDGTLKMLLSSELVEPDANLYSCSQLDKVPVSMEIRYFHTPHDSAESVGYIISSGENKIACCTDLGYVTQEVEQNLLGCDTVLIESNYDPMLLRQNTKYPPYLKSRISGRTGHLSNADSADFCAKLVKNGTRRLILGHLSAENNTPEKARSTVSAALNNHGMTCGVDYTLNVAPVMTSGEYISL